ncbi:hypothetical protein WA026_012966 [Henosepilachna vigintioctopunctata]
MESQLKCEMYKDRSNKRILAAHTDKVLYTGEIESENDLQYNFLVIKKRNSDRVRLINIENVTLKPYIKQLNVLQDSSVTGEKVSNAEFNKLFGSKKAKRITEQRERMKLDIENVKEELEKTVAATKIDDSYLNTSVRDNNSLEYKPPINRDASSVERVYELENLIPSDVLAALDTELDAISTSDTLENIELFEFSKQHISQLIEHMSETNKIKCKIYIFINYLLKFLATPVKNMSRKFILCKTSKEIDYHILNTFSIQAGLNRTRPLSMRDKTVCYILTLAMLASNYKLDLEVLSKDMKIGIKKLQEMSRILAFSSNGPKSVTLKLPLPGPAVSNLKRKRNQ